MYDYNIIYLSNKHCAYNHMLKIVNNMYEDNTVNIYTETFDKDFDEVSWEPETDDDLDIEAAELYDY